MSSRADYTPALGRADWTAFYDLALKVGTREGAWRRALLELIDPRPGQTILDVGCGTGSLAVLLKKRCPAATVVGVDPDPKILEIATAKAKAAGLDVTFRQGFARDASRLIPSADVAVSSLVFHQTPLDEKRAGLAAMFDAVGTTGRVVVADYARQRGVMRHLFRIVQQFDGHENTEPNAKGFLEEELSRLAGRQVERASAVHTLTGTISVFRIDGPAGSRVMRGAS